MIVEDVLQSIVNKGANVLYQKYINAKILPYLSLQILQLNFKTIQVSPPLITSFSCAMLRGTTLMRLSRTQKTANR